KLLPIGTITLKPGEPLHVQLKVHNGDQWKDFAWYALGPGVPSDARIDPTAGVLEWMPPPNSIKEYDFSVEAHYNQASDSAKFRVELPWARGNLVFDSPGNQTVAVDQPLTVPLKLHDDLGDARGVKFSISSEATGATVEPALRQFQWKPGESDVDKSRSF